MDDPVLIFVLDGNMMEKNADQTKERQFRQWNESVAPMYEACYRGDELERVPTSEPRKGEKKVRVMADYFIQDALHEIEGATVIK